MASNGRVIVGCSHGAEDPDRIVVAYLTRPTGEARSRPVHRPGAQLQGAAPLIRVASDGVTTFNYDDAARRPLAGV